MDLKDTKIYVALAYSPNEKRTEDDMEQAFIEANLYAAQLMAKGYRVFSPISHSHAISQYLPMDLRCNWEFWAHHDLAELAKCDELHVLTNKGWLYSTGVKAEIDFAVERGIPVHYVDKDDAHDIRLAANLERLTRQTSPEVTPV